MLIYFHCVMPAFVKNIDAPYWNDLKNGDSAALGFLYDKYVDKLFATAYRLTKNRELARDAVQEVFLEIWQYRHSITEVQYSQSYLSKVLLSLTLKKIKKEKLSVHKELEESLVAPDLNIENLLVARDLEQEKKTRLANAIAKLTERQKQVLKLHYTDGLSYEQIAEKLSINYQSVNNLAFRTISQLRNLMYSILIALLCGLSAVL